MPFHVDLHLHSHFSRATSKNLNLEYLSRWAQLKGIRVVGSGDFVHPAWMEELEKKLEPAEEGLFKLKPEYERATQDEVPPACRAPVRFMLTVEISNIYKRLGRVRKVHNVLFAPGFDAARKIQARLDTIGNIRSDGRPILGLDSRDLLEITLESDPLSYLIPAHIWTPWFSALGSKGGFDRMEDCFGDLTPHIFAVETGLSSDPMMNWRLTQLDPYVVVSNSDAHSPPKLGRETTIYDTECTYPSIYKALSDPDDPGLVGTVEFFPEEGKYHYDGHRKCSIRLHPRETIAQDGLCPACNKPVTIGVMARVEELADRPEGVKSPRWRPYHSLIPLPEIIGEAKQVGPKSKTVDTVFQTMLARLGNEFHILMDTPLEDIEPVAGSLIAEGIRRVRAGEVDILPGFDGEFGILKLFEDEERQSISGQTNLLGFFGETTEKPTKTEQATPLFSASQTAVDETSVADLPADVLSQATEPQHAVEPETPPESFSEPSVTEESTMNTPGVIAQAPYTDLSETTDALPGMPELLRDLPLNQAQQQAVAYLDGHLLIVAGPGTGKTHTLTHRIAYLAQHVTTPAHMLAMTFTNKAAEEMQARLVRLMAAQAGEIMVGTFHSVCLSMLRDWVQHSGVPVNFTLATPNDLDRLMRTLWPEDTNAQRRQRLEEISQWKAKGRTEEMPETVSAYTRFLRQHGLLDFDDVILETLKLLQASDRFRAEVHDRFRYLFVDEYQDINPAQHALLKALVEDGVQMTAIGDPNQAIYGFRGAESKFFHTFSDDFPHARILYLSENYRSAPAILNASSQVIGASDAMQVPALTATMYVQGHLTIHEAATDKAEAEYVVHQIERLVGGTSLFSHDSGRVDTDSETERSFGDVAVLYRMNSQHTALAEALERSGMPYQIAGDTPLIDRPAVQEIVTMLRLSYGMPVTTGAGIRLLSSTVDGLGDRTAERIEQTWKQRTQITTEHIRLLLNEPRLLMERSRSGLDAILEDIEALTTELLKKDAAIILSHIMDTSIWSGLKLRFPKAEDYLQKLIRCARLETNLLVLLDKLLLSRDYDAYGGESERVMLMTLHAAKGLEFPVVFIVGCEHDLIPLQYPGMASDKEEERRLFYVGMTRAKEQLYFVRAKRRMLFGNVYQTYPSPFLSEIEDQLKQYEKLEKQPGKRKKKAAAASQMDLFG